VALYLIQSRNDDLSVRTVRTVCGNKGGWPGAGGGGSYVEVWRLCEGLFLYRSRGNNNPFCSSIRIKRMKSFYYNYIIIINLSIRIRIGRCL
jgi:hypothetical protein